MRINDACIKCMLTSPSGLRSAARARGQVPSDPDPEGTRRSILPESVAKTAPTQVRYGALREAPASPIRPAFHLRPKAVLNLFEVLNLFAVLDLSLPTPGERWDRQLRNMPETEICGLR
jgi:hypothetical protein